MIALRGAHRARKSLKNSSSMRKAIPESLSSEKTRLRVSHSAARKPFAKGFSKEQHYENCEHSFNSSAGDGAWRSCYTRTRRTGEISDSRGGGFACPLAQPRVETGRFGNPQAARSL